MGEDTRARLIRLATEFLERVGTTEAKRMKPCAAKEETGKEIPTPKLKLFRDEFLAVPRNAAASASFGGSR